MIETVTILVGLIGVWLLAVVLSMLKSMIEGEVRGTIDDRLRSRVHDAAAQLPPEIAEDYEDEWLAELDATRERPRLAWRFVRGLPIAVQVIVSGTAPRDNAAPVVGPAGSAAIDEQVLEDRQELEATPVKGVIYRGRPLPNPPLAGAAEAKAQLGHSALRRGRRRAGARRRRA